MPGVIFTRSWKIKILILSQSVTLATDSGWTVGLLHSLTFSVGKTIIDYGKVVNLLHTLAVKVCTIVPLAVCS